MTDTLQIKADLAALAAEIGENAYVGISLNAGQGAVRGVIYPQGILDKVSLHSEAATFDEIAAAMRQSWDDHSTLHGENITREIALAIIRISFEKGECTDAALRVEFGSDADKFSVRALEKANEMAASGPFTIVITGTGNQ